MTMMEMAAVLKLASDYYLKNGDEAGTCREKETCHIIAATLRIGCLLILDKERMEDSRKSILDQYDRAITEIFEGTNKLPEILFQRGKEYDRKEHMEIPPPGE